MKILLVKLNHIGDTLILTPTIHAIREAYPHAVIDVVVRKGCEGVLEKNPDIDRIIPLARPEKSHRTLHSSVREFLSLFRSVGLKRYDYAFDLSNSDRAKLILLLSAAKRRGINRWHNPLGWKRFLFTDFSDFAWGKEHQVLKDFRTVADIMNLPGEPGPLRIATDDIPPSLLERFGLTAGSYAVIHPTSRWSFKEWEVQKWRQIIPELTDRFGKVLITCGPDPREIAVAEAIAADLPDVALTRGVTTLRELAYLIRNARLFLGIDTVAMHIAAAVQTPTVALFGPTDEWSWGPWSVPHRLVLGECPCKAARRFTCDKNRLLPCMEAITADEVLQNVSELITE